MTPKAGDIWELSINKNPIYLMLLCKPQNWSDGDTNTFGFDVLDVVSGERYTEVIEPRAPFWRKLA